MRWNDKRGMLNVGDFYKNDKFGENSEFVAKKGALYWDHGLRQRIMRSDNCDVFCVNSICVLCFKTKVCAKKISQTMANLKSHILR